MKTKKQKNVTKQLLGKTLTIVIILLLALVSFVGIYVTDKNSMKNVIPEYKLGMDLTGARNIVIKVDDSTEIKKYDSEGNLITDDSSSEDIEFTEVEEPVNSPDILTTDNYNTVKSIIEERLSYMQIEEYLLRYDESTGRINIEVPENSSTDYIAQYTITKGEFKVSDNDTSEVLLTNEDLKGAKVQYYTDTTGTTVFLSIEFNKEGTKKLQDISNTYISSEDSEGNTTTKTINMTLDDETIISTYFQEEITDGIIQLSMGTSTNTSDIQNYLQQASNLAIFLNTEPMPITYKMELNRFVYSDLTTDTLKAIIIGLLVVALIMAIFMIVRYKKNGIIGVLVNIGFMAILLIVIRYCNVVISLSGVFTIAVVSIIEYIITMLILKEYDKQDNLENINKNVKQILGKIVITLIPLSIMSITFTLMSWEEIASVGMILFWALLIMAIYNAIILIIKLFSMPNNSKEKISTKKEKKSDKIEIKRENKSDEQESKRKSKLNKKKTKRESKSDKEETKKKKG